MFDTICHEHLEYYSSEVIINLCKKNGLRVFNIKSNDINGASKQYFVCHEDSNYKDNKLILSKVLKLERALKLTKINTFQNFIKSINNSRKKLNKLLKKYKKLGKKIHCYGASTKGNVLLQYYSIDNKIIDYVAESNSNKFILYTPGTNIKIISETLSRFYKPDYYLVLPWHFKKEILSRENLMIKKGTKFIFPLPRLEIF